MMQYKDMLLMTDGLHLNMKLLIESLDPLQRAPTLHDSCAPRGVSCGAKGHGEEN